MFNPFTRKETSVKRVLILMVVLAAAALVSASPASAQNTACALQGAYVFHTVITSPAPAHDLGTLTFTPPTCLVPGLPGMVAIESARVQTLAAYFVSGAEMTIETDEFIVTGRLAQYRDGIATSFVYSGVFHAGPVVFGGTALRQTP
jgi:hypothetical protein